MPPTPAPVLGLLQPSLGPCCYHGVALFGLSRSPLVLWEVSFFGISCFLFLHLFDVGREREKGKKKKKGFANSTSQVRNCFQAAVCLPQDSSVCSPGCWRRAQVIRSAALACVTKPKPTFTSSDCITHNRAHK